MDVIMGMDGVCGNVIMIDALREWVKSDLDVIMVRT